MTSDMENKLRSEFLDAAAQLLAEGATISDRLVAATVLGSMGDERFVPLLLSILQEDTNRQVQHKASQALARIGGDEARDGLQDLMYAENQYTRFLAAEALADIVSKGST